jgi:hypothetical protein
VPYADFHDPQSLNLYTYVRNIATTKVDSDGHQSGGPCYFAADPRGKNSSPCGSSAERGAVVYPSIKMANGYVNPEGEKILVSVVIGKALSFAFGTILGLFGRGVEAGVEETAGATADTAMSTAEKEIVRQLDSVGAKTLTSAEKTALEKNVRAILDNTIKAAQKDPKFIKSVQSQLQRARFENLSQIDPALRAEFESALKSLGIQR